MTMMTTDKAFVTAFRKEFIVYLSKTVDPIHPSEHDFQHVEKNISGVVGNGIGYVSRIFDGIKSLPILTQAEFTSLASEHGSVSALMQNILDEVSTFMLNPDKTSLHDDVIKALGREVYQGLLNAPTATSESIAKYFLAAVLSLYKQTLQANAAFTPKNFPYQSSLESLTKASQQLCIVIERNNLKVATNTQNEKSNLVLGSPDEVGAAASDLLLQVEKLIRGDNADPVQIGNAYREVDNFRAMIMDYYNDLMTQFHKDIEIAMQKAYETCLATGFAVSDTVTAVSIGINIDPNLSPAKKIEFLNIKVNALSAMLHNMETDESLTSEELTIFRNHTQEYLAQAEKALALYESYINGDAMSSDEDTATRMHECVNTGLQDLVSNIRPDALKVQPSKPLMHVFFRIIRALFIWRMVSESEQADIERAMNQMAVVEELKAQMSNKPLVESRIEENVEVETHSRTTSVSDEDLNLCPSPMSSNGDSMSQRGSPSGVADFVDYSEDTFKKMYSCKDTQGFFHAIDDSAMKKVANKGVKADISPDEDDARNTWVQS